MSQYATPVPTALPTRPGGSGSDPESPPAMTRPLRNSLAATSPSDVDPPNWTAPCLAGSGLSTPAANTNDPQVDHPLLPRMDDVSPTSVRTDPGALPVLPLNLDAINFPSKKIGVYTPRSRRELLQKYMAKRARRLSHNTIRYGVRKTLADARPRVKGRFAKTEEILAAADVNAIKADEPTKTPIVTQPQPRRHEGASLSEPGSGPVGPTRRSTRQPVKRTGPVHPDIGDPGPTRQERKLLKLALAKSVVETTLAPTHACPEAPVFRPTVEEFASPIEYIAKIQPEAQRYGICKIVPPRGWRPTFAVDIEGSAVAFETRRQSLHRLQEGIDYEDGRVHTFRSYRDHANAFRKQWFSPRGINPNTVTSAMIEEEYWRIVETGGPAVQVEYANDLDTAVVGSGFERAADPFQAVAIGNERVDFSDPEYYRTSAWNLNNLPFAHGSLLRHVHSTIKGINVPWLYCGMLFATFCWHTEDNYMYSVNYQHIGAKKRWYGIPASHSNGFEKVLKNRLPERFRETPGLLFHLTTMVPPSVLDSHGVEVYTLIQEPGDIVLTFPRAYHAGYSEGFNCNEACNFVLPSWIQYGRESIERYREVGRRSIFCHDRFIFHFGSTQSLEEYGVAECEMLLQDLRCIFQEEQRLKKDLLAAGLQEGSVFELSANASLDDKSMAQDEERECFICKHNVYFSCVVCSCGPTRLACLRHARSMCHCPMQQRTMIQWVNAAQLRGAIRRVQVKIQSLSRGGGAMTTSTITAPGVKNEPLSANVMTQQQAVEAPALPLSTPLRKDERRSCSDRRTSVTDDEVEFVISNRQMDVADHNARLSQGSPSTALGPKAGVMGTTTLKWYPRALPRAAMETGIIDLT